ncbi:hypothetical protein ITP53_39415 [Nonomuraea sp. K274]|uniref:Uncharacterized protein n=1 Tax=Nonomuraea cypriaca TaxID=1187855 RepID=A0A931F537_9ACTN|nr:hypothetical protein [Nonomuraea cypriaca]MBF8191663.1 hypothetical protein [Nonomuraea cypriaca]
MARTPVAVTALTEAGINPAAVDVAAELTDGNSFPWAAHRLVFVLNGDEAAITPTFVNPSTVGRSELPVDDLEGNSIAAGGYAVYGPFDPSYRQADGSVWIDWAGTTPAAVTVAVLDA